MSADVLLYFFEEFVQIKWFRKKIDGIYLECPSLHLLTHPSAHSVGANDSGPGYQLGYVRVSLHQPDWNQRHSTQPTNWMCVQRCVTSQGVNSPCRPSRSPSPRLPSRPRSVTSCQRVYWLHLCWRVTCRGWVRRLLARGLPLRGHEHCPGNLDPCLLRDCHGGRRRRLARLRSIV
jgi:hypothetical protein